MSCSLKENHDKMKACGGQSCFQCGERLQKCSHYIHSSMFRSGLEASWKFCPVCGETL